MLRRLVCSGVLAAAVVVPAGAAAVISAGTPTTTVPTTLADPLGSLSLGLQSGQFLLPIEITGASGLQDWNFDLTFDGAVVAPLDVGGLFQSVYQAEFSDVDPTLSDITSGGLSLPGVLQGIAGFSSGLSGDGVLAFVLFEFLPNQIGNDPGFGIGNPPVQPVPEPGTVLLLAAALLALGRTQSFRAWPLQATAR